jgi:hypothetical protein
MNNNARLILKYFSCGPNTQLLFTVLSQQFNSRTVDQYMHENLESAIKNFMYRTEQDFGLSDPMPGVTVRMQVESLNRQFITEHREYITDHVLRLSDDRPEYSVTDGFATSRFGKAHHGKTADDILDVWKANPTRGVQGRDDTQSDALGGKGMGFGMGTPNMANGGSANGYWGPSAATGNNMNPLDSCRAGDNATTGITFCDQSTLNTSNHVEQFNGTSYMIHMNKETGHTSTGFGISTPESDARLLSRRTFKNNERGEENGIPAYRARIQRRNHDYDASESFAGTERECMVHGYDMKSLYDRVDHKQKVRAKHGGGYSTGQYDPSTGDMKLQNW